MLKTPWGRFGCQSGKIVVIPIEEKEDTAQQLAAAIGDPAIKTGMHAFLNADGEVSINPDCIITPGLFTAETNKANSGVTTLAAVGTKIRALAFADTPMTTTDEAIQAESNHGENNLVLCHPHANAWSVAAGADVPIPLSVIAAGVQARTHLERGWWSLDNKLVGAGISGPARPIDFRIYDSGSEGTHLKGNRVTTMVKHDGFRLWGGHTADDGQLMGGTTVGRLVSWKLYDALERGLFPFIGVPGNANSIPAVRGTGEKFLADYYAEFLSQSQAAAGFAAAVN